MLIVDIRHWLNESMTAPALPQLNNKVEQLGRIIAYATDLNDDHPRPKCSRRPGRKPCPGKLEAFITENLEIYWHCPVCEDEGLISGWQGLLWDLLEDGTTQ